MLENSTESVSTSFIIRASESRPWMFSPLFPSSEYSFTISSPRRFAYSRITSIWLLVEYCWCSVDMRTYAAARFGKRSALPLLMRTYPRKSLKRQWRDDLRSAVKSCPRLRSDLYAAALIICAENSTTFRYQTPTRRNDVLL